MRKVEALTFLVLVTLMGCIAGELHATDQKESCSKRVLVTGGAGFLGSHLCERLLKEGHEVICLDNMCTGSLLKVRHLVGHPGFSVIKHDIIEPLAIEGKLDEIYNLACAASPDKYQKNSIHTLKTCFLGAMNILELAREKGAKILQASTSEVYGDPLEHPQKESYWGNVNPIGFRACYDEGKRSAETLFFSYNRQHGVKIKVVRIFNTYGPRMSIDDGRVVSNFIVQALSGEPLTLYGKGEQTRSFCYVDDLIDGFVAFMGTDDAEVGPINLGNPNEFTVHELALKVLDKTCSTSPLTFLPLPPDDPGHRNPDISKARAVMGWEPKVALEQGLNATIDYFKEQLQLRIQPYPFPIR